VCRGDPEVPRFEEFKLIVLLIQVLFPVFLPQQFMKFVPSSIGLRISVFRWARTT